MFKFAFPFIVLCASACSTLPNTGPSVSNISNYDGAQVVAVDSAMATSMKQTFLSQEASVRDANLETLSQPAIVGDYVLQPGDKIGVVMTTWSTLVNPATGNNSSTSQWSFTIAADGTVTLPYIKDNLRLAGMSIPQAQTYIAGLYVKRRIFLSPSVQVTVNESDAAHGVLVTGTIGAPKVLPWNAGGMTMAQALTKAMGDSQILGLQKNALNGGTSATSVTLVRQGKRISIPVDLALERDFPLMMNDKLIVSHKPAVQVTVMGGGISNGLYDFAQHPSLAQVVAQAKGLNPSTANAKAVYVFRNTDTPKLYSFAFKTTDAQFAAQQFPLMDADIVYVAESDATPILHLMSAIWPVANIASAVR